MTNVIMTRDVIYFTHDHTLVTSLMDFSLQHYVNYIVIFHDKIRILKLY